MPELAQLADRVDPVEARHLQVDQDHVRQRRLPRALDRLDAVRGLADDLQPRVGVEQLTCGAAGVGIVVDDQDVDERPRDRLATPCSAAAREAPRPRRPSRRSGLETVEAATLDHERFAAGDPAVSAPAIPGV